MRAQKSRARVSTPIPDAYFRNYAGSGKPYRSVWRDHSYVDAVIEQFRSEAAPRLSKVCVLGTGPGLILKEFRKYFPKWQLVGCEINEWAHERIPENFRRKIRCQSMQEYLREAAARRKKFDLTFSNSLIYLEREDLDQVLKDIFATTKFFHFNSSFRGAACPDRYRKILRTKRWWDAKLKAAGFVPLKDARNRHTFLWRGALV